MITIEVDVEAFRAILPELTPLRFSRAINNAVRTMANSALTELTAAVSSWNTDVEFDVEYDLRPSDGIANVSIGTKSQVFHWVDEGTPEHIIRPKKAKILRYPSSFAPKTSPGQLGSLDGSYSDEFLFAMEVLNPGIRARGFSDTISEMIYADIDDVVFDQISQAWSRQTGA